MIPLEDTFTDILGKAQRGLMLADEQLATRAGVTVADLGRVKSGAVEEEILRRLAGALQLGQDALVTSALKAWRPGPFAVEGLAQFNTPYEDMTVNSYLVWDPKTREAVAFDTGATCGPMIELAKAKGLKIKLILLTHTHIDHITDLARLKQETGASAFVCALEPTPGAESFSAGKTFTLGGLQIGSRQTSGHSIGGITFVISGLDRPVAVVGDAIFAGSMGGGAVSFTDALANNRKQILTLADETILCPGHGPLTTVGEEKTHNPFFSEFKKL
jgi:glyoxylase-like metal-dependent hydrolase (beta-lactamase superfamily II)